MKGFGVAVVCAALCVSAFGAEPVPRLKIAREDRGLVNTYVTVTDEYAFNVLTTMVDSELAKDLFTVYTQAEIDSQRAQDQQRIRDLEAKVTVLEQNARKLSDLYDRLSKQLNDWQEEQAKTKK